MLFTHVRKIIFSLQPIFTKVMNFKKHFVKNLRQIKKKVGLRGKNLCTLLHCIWSKLEKCGQYK
jgi:hypothetical protein